MSSKLPKWTGHLLAVALAVGVASMFAASGRAAECDQAPQPGKKCKSAYTTMPSDHTGTHECGGGFTDIAHNGTCDAPNPSPGDCCDMGTGQLPRKKYACTQDGETCKHEHVGGGVVDVCNC